MTDQPTPNPPHTPQEPPDGRLSAPQTPSGQRETRDAQRAARAASGGSVPREQIVGAMYRVFAPNRHLLTPEEIRLVDELTDAVLAVILPHGKFLGDQLRDAEADVTRVIALYEQWVKAGPPPLGTSMSRWWDRRLVELHDAILPPREQP